MKAFTISMLVICAVWVGVAFWGLRELQHVLEYTGGHP